MLGVRGDSVADTGDCGLGRVTVLEAALGVVLVLALALALPPALDSEALEMDRSCCASARIEDESLSRGVLGRKLGIQLVRLRGLTVSPMDTIWETGRYVEERSRRNTAYL